MLAKPGSHAVSHCPGEDVPDNPSYPQMELRSGTEWVLKSFPSNFPTKGTALFCRNLSVKFKSRKSKVLLKIINIIVYK